MAPFFEDVALVPTHALKRALFDKYGPSDKRIKNIEKATLFRVDGCEMFKGSNGEPLSHVCMIFVEVEGNARVTVRFHGNVPLEGPVQNWISNLGTKLGASVAQAPGLSFKLHKGEQNNLLSLAEAMKGVVVGRSYSTPSFKYTCPRVAGALKDLKDVLDGVWH